MTVSTPLKALFNNSLSLKSVGIISAPVFPRNEVLEEFLTRHLILNCFDVRSFTIFLPKSPVEPTHNIILDPFIFVTLMF
jgi:hypothetical protein